MAEVFIFRGFNSEEIENGKTILKSEQELLKDMYFVKADQSMAEENVELLLNRIVETEGALGSEIHISGNKTVIMAVNSQERAVKVMRTFKSVLQDPGEAAFAMITPTSLKWTLGYYMDHVCKEHEYMKTHNPADDPDMKKVNI